MKNYKNFRRLYENDMQVSKEKNHPEEETILKPETQTTNVDNVETPTFTQATEPAQVEPAQPSGVQQVGSFDQFHSEEPQDFTQTQHTEEKDINSVTVMDLLSAINLVDPLVKMGIESFIEKNKMALTNNLNQTSANVPMVAPDQDLNFSTAVQDQPELNFPAN
jgi:hypothetical protein